MFVQYERNTIFSDNFTRTKQKLKTRLEVLYNQPNSLTILCKQKLSLDRKLVLKEGNNNKIPS